jgi:predicted kinase
MSERASGQTAPRLVLLCGLPGSGKSTLARQLAAELPAVRLCADDWMTQLAVDLFDEDTRARLEAQFWELAQQLLRLGQDVILESGFWHRSERDELRREARALGATVDLRYLDAPFDERWRRVEARNAEGGPGCAVITRDQLTSWLPLFEAPTHDELDPDPT